MSNNTVLSTASGRTEILKIEKARMEFLIWETLCLLKPSTVQWDLLVVVIRGPLVNRSRFVDEFKFVITAAPKEEDREKVLY